MNGRILYGVLIVLAFAAVVFLLGGDPLYQSLSTLAQATQAMERSVFTASATELKYGGVYGLVSVLDDYSTWHDHAADTVIRRQARGYYGGFGIEIVSFQDTTNVWTVFPESPAAEAGIRLGDRLLAADSIDLVGMPLDSVHFSLMTIEGFEVPLTIYRPSDRSTRTILCRRGEIDVSTVTVWGRAGEIGYLSIGGFNQRTAGALRRALDTLSAAGITGFIVDLRGNPGGLLQSAVECAELFLPDEGPIVSVTGRQPHETIEGDPGPYPSQPLVLLVDGGSASGSELLAGCLQDWDRAVLIGSPTFGKGFVQNLFMLREQSSLRLTVGQYRTPSGRTFYRPDTTAAPDTTRFTSLVHGRTIVGEGQIFPDIGADNLDCPDYLRGSISRQAPFDFIAEQLDEADLIIDYELVDRFWSSRHGAYESELVGALTEAAPAALTASPEWQKTVAAVEQAERAHDRAAAADCLLFLLSRHLGRAGRIIPLLEDPLLATDPALSEAVSILRSPTRYEDIVTGRHTDLGPSLEGES